MPKNAQKIKMSNKSLALQRSYKVQGVSEPGLYVCTYMYCSKGEGILCMVSPELGTVLLHQDIDW
jgi:hypothetical protein